MTGRRAEKRRDLTERLEAVAFELFLRKGYDATSVAEIAAAAAVSERTYFRYFASKQDVVFAGVSEDIDIFRQMLHDALQAEEPTWTDVATALRNYADTREPTRGLNQRRAQLVQNTPVLQGGASRLFVDRRTSAVTVIAQRYHRRRDDPDVQILSGITIAVLVAAINAWIGTDGLLLADAVQQATERARRLLQT